MASTLQTDRLTQNQLALLLGWHQSHVTLLERGLPNPQLPTVEPLGEGLGLVVELRITDPTPDAMGRKLQAAQSAPHEKTNEL